MAMLPIVQRELRVASRRRTTYTTRLGAAFLALLAGSWVAVVMLRQPPREFGLVLFVVLAIFVLLYSLLIGARTTADCLSEEKREGTLGLMFLTDLKGYDVVLGKLAATSVHAIYGLLAVLPLMAIPLLLGGVTPAEFGRVILVSLDVLFFSLCVGLAASAVCRDERKAVGLTLGIVLWFTFIFPLIGWGVQDYFDAQRPSPLFFIPSPGYAAFSAFEAPRRGLNQFLFFYSSVFTIHGLSWVALVIACRALPHAWQDKATGTKLSGWQGWRRRWGLGKPAAQQALRRELLDLNPFCWLAARDRFQSSLAWVGLVSAAVLWIWGLLTYPTEWLDPVVYVWTAVMLHSLLKVLVAEESGRRLSLDRRSRALELLLATPLSVKQILAGQRLALMRQFAVPTVIVLLMDVVFLIAGLAEIYGGGGEWSLVWIAGMIMLVADLYTLSWVGMWMGLNSSSVNRASSAALVRVCVLPWLIFGLLLTFFAITNSFAQSNDDQWLTWIWLVVGLVVDLAFGVDARNKLLLHFRTIATEPVRPKAAGWWQRWAKADRVPTPGMS